MANVTLRVDGLHECIELLPASLQSLTSTAAFRGETIRRCLSLVLGSSARTHGAIVVHTLLDSVAELDVAHMADARCIAMSWSASPSQERSKVEDGL